MYSGEPSLLHTLQTFDGQVNHLHNLQCCNSIYIQNRSLGYSARVWWSSNSFSTTSNAVTASILGNGLCNTMQTIHGLVNHFQALQCCNRIYIVECYPGYFCKRLVVFVNHFHGLQCCDSIYICLYLWNPLWHTLHTFADLVNHFHDLQCCHSIYIYYGTLSANPCKRLMV